MPGKEESFHELTGNCPRASQPLIQLGPAPPSGHVLHGDRHRLALADDYHQALATSNTSIQQVALKHGVMLRQDRDDNGGVLRSLAFVNRCGVGQYQRIKFLSDTVNNCH